MHKVKWLVFFGLAFSLVFVLPDLNAADYIVTYDSTNAHDNIVSALNAADANPGYDRIIFEYQGAGTVWKTTPIYLKDDIEVYLEPGVIIESTSGYVQGNCVFHIDAKDNVTISGYGATIRMLIDEYTSGQWRHCMKINSCTNITIEGVRFETAGGDGVCLCGSIEPDKFCDTVLIKDAIFDGNARNGVAIISGKNIDIEDCIFLNTGRLNTGTLAPGPRAGIDLEPDNYYQLLQNISISNCIFDNNELVGIQICLDKLNDTSASVSNIDIGNCSMKDSKWGMYIFLAAPGVTGDIDIKNVSIENTVDRGILFYEWGDDMYVNLEDVYLSKPTIYSTNGAIEFRNMGLQTCGNVNFSNVCIRDSEYSDYALLVFGGSVSYYTVDLTGEIYALWDDAVIELTHPYNSNVTVALNLGEDAGIWHFEEGTGTSADDSSSNSNDAVLWGGVTWTGNGKLGNAVQLDGVDDVIYVDDSNSLDITDAISVEAWVKFTDVDDEYQYILEKGPYATGGYRLFWNYGGNNRFYFATSNGSEHGGYTTTKTLQSGVWYHILCVDTGYAVYFYLNGEKETLYSGSHTIAATSNDLYIGSRSTGSLMEGAIDEVKIYNWPLGDNDVLEHYLYADTRVNLSFNEGTGAVAEDSSAFGNDGTLAGGAAWVADGKSGSAIEFDGVNDYVTCGNDSSVNITGPLTIETWVKFSDVDQQYQHIFANGPHSVGGYRLFWNYGGNKKLYFATSNGSEHGGYSSTKDFENDVWYHIVCVDTLDNVYLYVNGEQETLYSGNHTITASSTSLFIGRRSSGDYFDGIVDEFRVYNKALSADEAARRYFIR